MVWEWGVYFETELKRRVVITIRIHSESVTIYSITKKLAMCKAYYNIIIYISSSRGSFVEKYVIGICTKRNQNGKTKSSEAL